MLSTTLLPLLCYLLGVTLLCYVPVWHSGKSMAPPTYWFSVVADDGVFSESPLAVVYDFIYTLMIVAFVRITPGFFR